MRFTGCAGASKASSNARNAPPPASAARAACCTRGGGCRTLPTPVCPTASAARPPARTAAGIPSVAPRYAPIPPTAPPRPPTNPSPSCAAILSGARSASSSKPITAPIPAAVSAPRRFAKPPLTIGAASARITGFATPRTIAGPRPAVAPVNARSPKDVSCVAASATRRAPSVSGTNPTSSGRTTGVTKASNCSFGDGASTNGSRPVNAELTSPCGPGIPA